MNILPFLTDFSMFYDIEVKLEKHFTLWAKIQVKFFGELPQEGVGNIKLGLKVYGKQGSFKS